MSSREEPSWWKYVGGRDSDRIWSASYVASIRKGREMAARDRDFYLAAIARLAADDYQPERHRPKDRAYFWLSCHYWLACHPDLGEMGVSKTEAALDCVKIAKQAGIRRGHDYKALQRHANLLVGPVEAFLLVLTNLPLTWPKQPSPRQLRAALMKWIEQKLREVA